MKSLRPEEPLHLSPAELKAFLTGFIAGRSEIAPMTVYFPSQIGVSREVDVYALATPWQDLALQGLRISNFNQTGLRILYRRGDKVESSKPIEPTSLDRIYAGFCSFIEVGLGRLATLVPGQVKEVVYKKEDFVRLLAASFLEQPKPRVIPRIVWPERAEALSVLKEILPPLPWVDENFMGRRELKLEKGDYTFLATGERGEIESQKSAADLDEVLAHMLDFFTMRNYLEDDKNFVFDYLY